VKQAVYVGPLRAPKNLFLNVSLYLRADRLASFRASFVQFNRVLLQRELAEVVLEDLQ
jgi:hypothetical protein